MANDMLDGVWNSGWYLVDTKYRTVLSFLSVTNEKYSCEKIILALTALMNELKKSYKTQISTRRLVNNDIVLKYSTHF